MCCPPIHVILTLFNPGLRSLELVENFIFRKFGGHFDILEQKSPLKLPKPLKTLKPLNSGSAKI